MMNKTMYSVITCALLLTANTAQAQDYQLKVSEAQQPMDKGK